MEKIETQRIKLLINNILTGSSNKNPGLPQMGDILGISRIKIGLPYEHYGIYTEKGTVIHYTAPDTGFKLSLQIRETNLKDFLGTDKVFFILDFDHLNNPVKSPAVLLNLRKSLKTENAIEIFDILVEIWDLFEKAQMKLYSPQETIDRARIRVGEKKYNLIWNNCEHFAIWCKTGLNRSHQVERLLKIITKNIGV